MRVFVILIVFAWMGDLALAQKPRGDTRAYEIPQSRPDRERSSSRQQEREFERTLPYLAHTLGELHYLSYACEGLDAQEWREHMVDLMSMEAPERGRDRDRLVEAFNEGYRTQQRYRPICGPEVDAERRVLAQRGQDLSEMMRAAYFD